MSRKSGIILICIYLLPVSLFATGLQDKLLPYIKNGSVLVADDQSILFSYHAEKMLVPASILKLATALAALHYLGEHYRYKTEFYLNKENDLTVRGFGDPLLVSEELKTIALKLSQQDGLPPTLRHLYLDASSFASDIRIPGVENSLNPYDALNGALVANFNTAYVVVDENRKIRSAEEQTPLIPLTLQLAKGLAPGKHRINISQQSEYVLPYLGGLLKEFLSQHGITVTGQVAARSITPRDQLILDYQNPRPLRHTIESMMLYSNNFIANQLLLTVGLQQFGNPARLDHAVKSLHAFLENVLKIPPAWFQLTEGSGISRKNRIDARAMLQLLKAFHPHRHLLAEHQGLQLKTGTLKGVYTMAGYLSSPSHRRYFVIMLNQEQNYRDRILSLLRREFLNKTPTDNSKQ